MKKLLLLFAVASISFSHGEISFTKQKEKVEQERLLKLKTQTENTVEESEKEKENDPQKNTLFEDDVSGTKTKTSSRTKNAENRKLIEYVKTQNKNLSEAEIKNILGG